MENFILMCITRLAHYLFYWKIIMKSILEKILRGFEHFIVSTLYFALPLVNYVWRTLIQSFSLLFYFFFWMCFFPINVVALSNFKSLLKGGNKWFSHQTSPSTGVKLCAWLLWKWSEPLFPLLLYFTDYLKISFLAYYSNKQKLLTHRLFCDAEVCSPNPERISQFFQDSLGFFSVALFILYSWFIVMSQETSK